jgi:hypothetical protein
VGEGMWEGDALDNPKPKPQTRTPSPNPKPQTRTLDPTPHTSHPEKSLLARSKSGASNPTPTSPQPPTHLKPYTPLTQPPTPLAGNQHLCLNPEKREALTEAVAAVLGVCGVWGVRESEDFNPQPETQNPTPRNPKPYPLSPTRKP